MARRTIIVCDDPTCGKEIKPGDRAVMRLNYDDGRMGSKQADLHVKCAAKLPGVVVPRRGRKPASRHLHAA